jgi:hypothetical protein
LVDGRISVYGKVSVDSVRRWVESYGWQCIRVILPRPGYDRAYFDARVARYLDAAAAPRRYPAAPIVIKDKVILRPQISYGPVRGDWLHSEIPNDDRFRIAELDKVMRVVGALVRLDLGMQLLPRIYRREDRRASIRRCVVGSGSSRMIMHDTIFRLVAKGREYGVERLGNIESWYAGSVRRRGRLVRPSSGSTLVGAIGGACRASGRVGVPSLIWDVGISA